MLISEPPGLLCILVFIQLGWKWEEVSQYTCTHCKRSFDSFSFNSFFFLMTPIHSSNISGSSTGVPEKYQLFKNCNLFRGIPLAIGQNLLPFFLCDHLHNGSANINGSIEYNTSRWFKFFTPPTTYKNATIDLISIMVRSCCLTRALNILALL